MATRKATLIFNFSQWGFTESYYFDDAGFFDIPATLKQMAAARVRMCAAGVILKSIRLSYTDNSQRPQVVYARGDNGFGPNSGAVPDTPWNAWLCSFRSVTGRTRQLYLRGVPDSSISFTTNGEFAKPQDDFYKDFVAFKNFLVANGFGMRYRRTGTGSPPITKITAVAGDGDGFVVITSPGAALAAGQTVVIKGMKGSGTNCFNGLQVIKSVQAGSSFSLYQQTNAIVFPDYTGKGTVQIADYAFDPLRDGEMIRAVERKTGRAFFGTRGRRRANRCCPRTRAG